MTAICCHVLEWIHKYTESFIQPETLQERVDTFMREYDKRKEEVRPLQAVFSPLLYVLNSFNNLFQEAERQRKEAEHQHEDEEGWVKVTRGSKVKARPHSEAVNKRTLQKEMKKKKRKELLNFYTWQHKNTQKERKQICCIVYLPSTAFENLILISGKSNVN